MAIPGSQQLAASAYRTLGLSGSATQGQIDQAARKLRIWPDPKTIPPTPWDLKWLGPVSRSKNDIEQALARLSEPSTRIAERLMWFNGTDPKPWSGIDASRIAGISSPTNPADLHDRALYRLHMATVRDPNLKDPSQWQDVLTQLRELAHSDTYLEWIVDQENNGDFDKRARLEEVAEELQKLPDSLTAGFITRAEAALENDDFVVTGRILELLKGCGPDSGQSLAQIYDRAEDLIVRRCNRIYEDLRQQLHWSEEAFTNEQKFNQGVCREIATAFIDSVEPVVKEWDEFAPNDPERSERVRTSAAKTQTALAQSWCFAGRFIIAERTLRAALELSRGTSIETQILEMLPAYTQNARAEQAGYSRGGRQRVITTNPNVRIKPRTAVMQAPKRSSWFSFNGTGAGIGGGGVMLIIVILRIALIGARSAGTSSTGSGYQSSPSNYYRTPTPTMPEFQSDAPMTAANPQTYLTPQQRRDQQNLQIQQSRVQPDADQQQRMTQLQQQMRNIQSSNYSAPPAPQYATPPHHSAPSMPQPYGGHPGAGGGGRR